MRLLYSDWPEETDLPSVNIPPPAEEDIVEDETVAEDETETEDETVAANTASTSPQECGGSDEKSSENHQSSDTTPSETSSQPSTLGFSVPFTSTKVEVRRNTLLIGVAAGAAVPLLGAAALTVAGFGAAGVVAGSWAAGVQTATTAAGSWFATCQSLGATGYLVSSGVVASSGAATGAGVGAVCGTKVTKEEHADTTTAA